MVFDGVLKRQGVSCWCCVVHTLLYLMLVVVNNKLHVAMEAATSVLHVHIQTRVPIRQITIFISVSGNYKLWQLTIREQVAQHCRLTPRRSSHAIKTCSSQLPITDLCKVACFLWCRGLVSECFEFIVGCFWLVTVRRRTCSSDL